MLKKTQNRHFFPGFAIFLQKEAVFGVKKDALVWDCGSSPQ